MTRSYLKGGNESDSPLKHVGDGSFSSASDHSTTVMLLTFDDTNTLRGGNIGALPTLIADAAVSSTNANTAKGFTNALQLDGTGDQVDFLLGDDTSTNLLYNAVGGGTPIDCSIEMYLRATSALTGDDRGLFGIAGFNYFSLLYYNANDSINVYTGAGGWGTGDRLIGSSEIGTDTWHHVRVVHDVSESEAYFFLDGTLTATVSSVTGNMFGAGTGTSILGSIGKDNAFAGSNFAGQICGFAIRAGITASNSTFTPPTLSQLLAGAWE